MIDLVKESRVRLHSRGGRMTAQRRLILETLDGLSSHPSAEELYAVVNQSDPGLHLSTVYRTLRWLEQEGLVRTHHFDEDPHQDRFDPALPGEHYHFMCESCKTVIEFDNLLVDTIKKQFETHTGAQVETGSVMLYGLCEKCRQEVSAP